MPAVCPANSETSKICADQAASYIDPAALVRAHSSSGLATCSDTVYSDGKLQLFRVQGCLFTRLYTTTDEAVVRLLSRDLFYGAYFPWDDKDLGIFIWCE